MKGASTFECINYLNLKGNRWCKHSRSSCRTKKKKKVRRFACLGVPVICDIIN